VEARDTPAAKAQEETRMVMLLYLAMVIPPDISQEAEVTDTVKRCKELWETNWAGCCAYIRSLGQAGNLRLLRELYVQDDTPLSQYAAFIAAKLVKDKEIVDFCRQFKVNSLRWGAAFKSLEDRPKAVVMPYIRQVCATGDAHARFLCYEACWAAGWGDLLEQARADLGDETVVDSIPFGGPITLKSHAKYYVERFEKKQK
jgi:hypothetical protein